MSHIAELRGTIQNLIIIMCCVRYQEYTLNTLRIFVLHNTVEPFRCSIWKYCNWQCEWGMSTNIQNKTDQSKNFHDLWFSIPTKLCTRGMLSSNKFIETRRAKRFENIVQNTMEQNKIYHVFSWTSILEFCLNFFLWNCLKFTFEWITPMRKKMKKKQRKNLCNFQNRHTNTYTIFSHLK